MKKFAVIDTTANLRREKAIVYVGDFDKDDFIWCVQCFFDDAEIPASEEDIVDTAYDLRDSGYAIWDDYHFEVF